MVVVVLIVLKLNIFFIINRSVSAEMCLSSSHQTALWSLVTTDVQ